MTRIGTSLDLRHFWIISSSMIVKPILGKNLATHQSSSSSSSSMFSQFEWSKKAWPLKEIPSQRFTWHQLLHLQKFLVQNCTCNRSHIQFLLFVAASCAFLQLCVFNLQQFTNLQMQAKYLLQSCKFEIALPSFPILPICISCKKSVYFSTVGFDVRQRVWQVRAERHVHGTAWI
jgi:hypothetical protein